MQNTSGLSIIQRIAERTVTPFCAVVGSTASGKTELAIRLAEETGAEILCVDAMQVYRGLDVGTAKATAEERKRVLHHGINLASPLENFSAMRFASYAEPILQSAWEKRKPLILCGGTGLYYRALLEGFFWSPDPDPELRASLYERIDQEGCQVLYDELVERDPEVALGIHANDARRVTRSLEIMIQTGQSVTELRRSQPKKPWINRTVMIGLDRSREELLERIEQRTAWMYQNGLIDETRLSMQWGCHAHHTAMQALGYKECLAYLRGKLSLSDAQELTVIATRQYAKRQMTWFRRQFTTCWIEMSSLNGHGSCKSLFDKIEQSVKPSLHLWQNNGNNIEIKA